MNGWEFDEEIEEIEESLEGGSADVALLSHENLFLLMVLAIVVIFGVILIMFTRKKRAGRSQVDSQV